MPNPSQATPENDATDERIAKLALTMGLNTQQAALIYLDVLQACIAASNGSKALAYVLVEDAYLIFLQIQGDYGDTAGAQAEVEAWLEEPPSTRILGAAWWCEAVRMERLALAKRRL
jgi:hypothetical protein